MEVSGGRGGVSLVVVVGGWEMGRAGMDLLSHFLRHFLSQFL